MKGSMTLNAYRKISYRAIASLPKCLEWLENDVLGVRGAAWARQHSQANNFKRADMLLKDLRKVWPQLLHFEDIPQFGAAAAFVSPSFLQSTSRDNVVEFSYPIILGRPPDEEGVRFYKSKLEQGYSQTKLINDFFSSKEAAAHMTRTILDGRTLSELRRTAAYLSSFVYFRNRKKVAPSFFDRDSLNTATNETGIDWHFLYKDEGTGKHILSPGMNLVGSIQPDGIIESGTEWILYGPKIQIPAGNYSIHIDIDADDSFKYYVDATGNGGVTHFFEANLSGSCHATINFEIPTRTSDFEFRMLNKSWRKQPIDLKVVNLKRA